MIFYCNIFYFASHNKIYRFQFGLNDYYRQKVVLTAFFSQLCVFENFAADLARAAEHNFPTHDQNMRSLFQFYTFYYRC